MGGTFLATIWGAFWDGHAVHLPGPVAGLGALVIATAYAPALAGWRLGVWARRLARRSRPWQEPLDLVVLAFWLTVAAHLLTWFGTSGVLRYTMTFYATVPVLGAVALASVVRGRPGAWAPASAAVAALFLYDGLTHAAFVREAAAFPWRPVDAAIQTLTRLGVRACYADSRIAQVITFESAERITCADYVGFRDFARLQAVDAIEDPGTVAVVTHRLLLNPMPSVMEDALHLLGARAHRTEVGEYVIFHHARAPDDRVRPIVPDAWRATASSDQADASLAFDRKVWTRWTADQPRGQWFRVDLGREHRLAGLTLETAPLNDQAPAGLRVETSLDGEHWDLVAEDPDLMAGLHWWKDHPPRRRQRASGGGHGAASGALRPALPPGGHPARGALEYRRAVRLRGGHDPVGPAGHGGDRAGSRPP